MGQVYLVEHPTLERYETLMVLSTGAGATAEFTKRSARDARTAAGLQHPNNITVHADGAEGHDPWLTMRYHDDRVGTALIPWFRSCPRRDPRRCVAASNSAGGTTQTSRIGSGRRQTS
ncbi:MAG: hypothetical protein WAW85_14310 [Gordonia sp. (in: high G+C Gram-positive bacteria)]|uniref:hypothetical protein n=1 Tax=Gordonia sp. (in: high G+C Gram-positive bacteria) TaxID=84139 RepID=UPI003BB7CFBC